MANMYFSIPTESTSMAQIEAALTTKYAPNITIYVTTTTYIIFSCPAICSKVVRILKSSAASGYFQFYYGDAWTSGSTVTNQVTIQGSDNTWNVATAIHLVLGDDFLLFQATLGSVGHIAIIGKTTNNKFLYSSLICTSTTTWQDNTYNRNITDGEEFLFLGIERSFCNATSKLYKQPIYIVQIDGQIYLNADETFATIPGLYSISLSGASGIPTVLATALFSTINGYNTNTQRQLGCPLFVEF